MRRQDILVTLLHCLGFSVLRGWLMRSSREPITRFITFHDIPDDARAFEANLAFLQRRTHVVSFDDFLRGRLSTRRINIVIMVNMLQVFRAPVFEICGEFLMLYVKER